MKKYADDYEIVITEDANGKEKKSAVYRGDYYEVQFDESQLLRFKRINLLLLLIVVLFHVAAGFVANPGMYQFYVSVPYVIVFLPLFFIAEGIIRLPNHKKPFRRDEIGLSFDRVKTSSHYLFYILAAVIIGTLVFMIMSIPQVPIQEWVFLLLELGAAISALIILRMNNRVQVTLTVNRG